MNPMARREQSTDHGEMKEAERQKPAGWGKDDLSSFLGQCNGNAIATFARLPGRFSRLRDLDSLFVTTSASLNNRQGWLPPVLFIRAHASFRGAVGLAMACQLPEAYMVMRGCLENSLYAFYLHRNPELSEIWLRRTDSAEARQRVKDKFKIGVMLDLVEKEDARIGSNLRVLYEQTVDMGAHPNEESFTTNAQLTQDSGTRQIQMMILNCEPIPLQVCLKTLAQVGVGSLRVFERIYPERFRILDADRDLQKLSVCL